MTRRKTIDLREPDVEVRSIPGYEGLYSVTNNGRVWSHAKVMGVSRHGGRWLKPANDAGGYPFVCMTKEKVRTLHRVHRLVAAAWVPDNEAENGRRDVNHINGTKTDNRATNLEWCTRSQNNLHALRTGLRRPPRTLTPEMISLARALCNAGMKQCDAADQLGISRGLMSRVINGYQPKSFSDPIHPLRNQQCSN